VEDMSLLFGIGDKVIMATIISEDPSYEENQLKKKRDFSCMFCNLSHEKNSGRRGYFIGQYLVFHEIGNINILCFLY
jgi:hypothetical protein